MDRDTFKLIHSELIQQVQCIEFNLRRTYAAMHEGNFDDNFNRLEKSNLGKIARELENLDYSDDRPELSDDDYDLIDDIREIRNYWCHQCYLDFVYYYCLNFLQKTVHIYLLLMLIHKMLLLK